MAEYIKRTDVMKICEGYSEHCFNSNDSKGQDIADRILDDVVEIPTADVVEVKYGEWKHECLECSVCKRNISEICDADSYLTSGIEDELLFCPFCGTKMDGRRDT